MDFHLKLHFSWGGGVSRGRRGQWGRSVVSPVIAVGS